ncbi:RNA-dependent RNA polymerase family protein, partial [Jatrophihabitans lederbergiae]
FRIASKTLADARGALEACAEEVRELGLVLNERKTFTYGAKKYERSLTAFADAERDLFATEADEGDDEDPFALARNFHAAPVDRRSWGGSLCGFRLCRAGRTVWPRSLGAPVPR